MVERDFQAKLIKEIKDIFNSGITFWHKDRGARILNYNVKNEVVE